jgi:hypothetical protein
MTGLPEKVDLLQLLTVGGRLSGERSRALPTHYYGNPADNVKFASETIITGGGMETEKVRTKDAEAILSHEIENWIRWGRKKDWRPASFRCPLGFLYKSSDTLTPTYRPPECKEIEAVKMERIVVGLPQRHRQAFVMHHLERAAVDGQVFIQVGRNQAARILGVQLRQYHYLVNQAHTMVLREYNRLENALGESD